MHNTTKVHDISMSKYQITIPNLAEASAN